MIKKRKTVLIAMSGGVDSSVAAALLKKKGYNCIGAFFITWTENISGLIMCPWEQDVFDARQVCQKLNIPLYVFDFEKEYRERVIEYFFREYQAGRTPNPDVMCNKEIKFNLFLQKAKELGADYIATGHYARIKKSWKGECQLLKGRDPNKDQSYFLHALNQEQLRSSLFPVGNLRKSRVRALAKKFDLPNWNKKDSQGICFLGEVKLTEFLQSRLPITVGNIVDEHGTILGQHQGVNFYTIGQRHGLKIGGSDVPYYVVKKDIQANTLVVSKGNQNTQLQEKTLIASHQNWINKEPTFPLRCNAKIRYRQPDQKVIITQTADGRLRAEFKNPQRAVTPGQSLVLYKKSKLLGGAIIESCA